MKKIALFALAVLSFTTFSCNSDNDEPVDVVSEEQQEEPAEEETPETALTPEEQVEENIEVLTAGEIKVWKINSATLVNNSGSIDISENFNIQDDEFVFSFSSTSAKSTTGVMEWRQGNSVETSASDAEGSEEDFYKSPLKFQFELAEENPNEITISGNEDSFTFEDSKIIEDEEGNSSFSAVIIGTDGAKLEVSSTEKKPEDYRTFPNGIVKFSNAFSFESNAIECCAPGMVGSYADNSFFIVTKEFTLRRDEDFVAPERILKFDLKTGDVTEKLFFLNDIVTKQVHIIDNKLRVVGGEGINTYDIDILEEPSRDAHGLRISRSGTAVLDNEIYVVGGDLENVLSDKIFKWDEISKNLLEVATMPEPRFGARSEIINNQLYIFGGTEEFFTPPAKNSIYIYDLETEEFNVEALPRPIDLTYTGKFENLIYVAGRELFYETDENGDLERVNSEPFLGVYDTNTATFTELETNLESPGQETIHGMAIFQKKIFVIYGASDNGISDEELATWNVMSAEL